MRRPQAGSLLCVLVAGLTWFSPALARAEPPAKSRLSTATYDVADLIQSVPTWRRVSFVAPDAGVEGADALVQVIMRMINPESWRPGPARSTIQVVNDTKLEIRTTLRQHAEIKDLLKTLRHLSDLAVVFWADLYEVDRAFYRNHLEPVLAPRPGEKLFAVSVEDAIGTKLRNQSKPLKESRVMIANGKEGVFFSLRNGFTYLARARTPGRDEQDVTGTGFQGVTFRADVSVSADRRSVRLKMSQKATELREIVKKTILDPNTKKKEQVETPRLVSSSTTGEGEIDDGTALLIPVRYRSQTAKDNDRVWVLFLRPLIYIEAEEKERANNEP
ncbi:MAG TPA: hypothetical protein VKD72_37190 [Gemmataceae bacterium]|nr:hypothetical protein [Gemmataceae bacterium]